MALKTLATMPDTCALDVADRAEELADGTTLEAISELLQLSRERIRQIQDIAVHKLEEAGLLDEFAGPGRVKKKHGPEPQPVLSSLDFPDD
jgi:hypothetical protein